MNVRGALLLTTLVLAACGGGGGGSAVPSGAANAAPQSKGQNGTFVLSIPTNPSSSSAVRYPKFVSPNATSVSLVVNTGAAQTFDVSSGSPLCTTTGGARTCILSFFAPLGSDTMTFTIYQGAGGTGNVLASGTTSTTVTLGTPFNVTVAMNATIGTVVANAALTGAQTCPNVKTPFAGIEEGCAGTAAVTITAFDPTGAQITGSAPYTTPIQITTSDPSLTATPATITAPGQTTSINYSGSSLAAAVTNSVTVTMTIAGVTIPTSVPVTRQYLYVANANAGIGSTPPGGGNIAVYQFGATGAATPVRVLAGASTQLMNPVDVKLDANDNLYVLDNGPYTSNSNPYILVFAPGANGNVAPIRTISAIAGIDFNTGCESMVFDPTGQFLDVMCDDSAGTIHVLMANANGSATTAQVASLIDDSSFKLIDMAYDNSGNLWISDVGSGSPSQAGLLFVPGPIPTSGALFQMFGASKVLQSGSASFAASNSGVGVYVDAAGTLYSAIGYFSPAGGGPDATNEIGIWSSGILPCSNCAPSRAISGAPLTTHTSVGITVDAAGNVYTSNLFTNTIYVFSRAQANSGGAGLTPLHTILTGATPSNPVTMTVGP